MGLSHDRPHFESKQLSTWVYLLLDQFGIIFEANRPELDPLIDHSFRENMLRSDLSPDRPF